MSKYWDAFPEHDARMYSLKGGLLYTARFATPFKTARVPAVLLLSLSDKELLVESGAGRVSGRALLVGPRVSRRMQAWDAPFAGIHIGPSHPAFRGLGRIAEGRDIVPVEHDLFSDLKAPLSACVDEAPDTADVQIMFDSVIETLADHLDIDQRRDRRIENIISHLVDQSPLDYAHDELLKKASLSAGRLSHLFTKEVGIPLRSFHSWQKIRAALSFLQSTLSLTNVAYSSGFSDSAHFSRTFSRSFGLIPSMFQHDRCVQVIEGRCV